MTEEKALDAMWLVLSAIPTKEMPALSTLPPTRGDFRPEPEMNDMGKELIREKVLIYNPIRWPVFFVDKYTWTKY